MNGVLAMKISGYNLSAVLRAYQEKMNQKQLEGPERDQKRDRVTLTRQAENFRAALEKLKEEPEIREALVQDLRQEIAQGKYNIDGPEVARHMIENLLTEDESSG